MDTAPTHTSGDLAEVVAEVFASLPRKDQRATSSYYLQGLMLEGRRKSMQPMAERLGIDHQRLQQFVSSSPWKVEPVRQTLAGAVAKFGRQEDLREIIRAMGIFSGRHFPRDIILWAVRWYCRYGVS